MSGYTHIAWDFNGTLLNDVEPSVQAANALLRQYGLPELESVEAYRRVFGFPVIDYYRRLGFDFDTVSYDVLAPEWVAYYRHYTQNVSVFPEIPEILAAVRAAGKEQMIVTASWRDLIEEQLATLGIRHFFGEVLALDNIHAESKTQLAARWRQEHPEARVLFIGDTEHDLETAKAMGADCLLVACGHRPFDALAQCKNATAIPRLDGWETWLMERIR